MEKVDQRAVLERLIQQRGEDYTGLSRLLGRNPAYVQQFIKRGIPKRLAEEDRRTLSRYFGIDDGVLGGPRVSEPGGALPADLTSIPRLDVDASAGPGSLNDRDTVVLDIAFNSRWLRQLCRARPEDLSIIQVQGDSMVPTLVAGDEIMVDRGDAAARLRDGIYVLRLEDALVVKRIAANPVTRKITIKSDNDAYPDWPNCNPRDIEIIGRVVWAGRKIS